MDAAVRVGLAAGRQCAVAPRAARSNRAALICERPALCRQTNSAVAITPPPREPPSRDRPPLAGSENADDALVVRAMGLADLAVGQPGGGAARTPLSGQPTRGQQALEAPVSCPGYSPQGRAHARGPALRSGRPRRRIAQVLGLMIVRVAAIYRMFGSEIDTEAYERSMKMTRTRALLVVCVLGAGVAGGWPVAVSTAAEPHDAPHPAPAQHNPAPTHHDPAPARHNPTPTHHDPAPTHHDPAPARHNPTPTHHDPAPTHQQLHAAHRKLHADHRRLHAAQQDHAAHRRLHAAHRQLHAAHRRLHAAHRG
jgi:hypothetical protein